MLYNGFLDDSDKRAGGNFHPPKVFRTGNNRRCERSRCVLSGYV